MKPNPPRPKPCDDDGGSAYPAVDQMGDGPMGMSLRDAFAIAALQGLCANPTNSEVVRGLQHFPTFGAAWAFRMADACLDERAKGRTE